MIEYSQWAASWQGNYKKVLCVCTAGLLRSPTAAWVLSNTPYNFNTRSCGIDKTCALIQCDNNLIGWADEIVCMNKDHKVLLIELHEELLCEKRIINLNIPDTFKYRDPKLVKLIRNNYNEIIAS